MERFRFAVILTHDRPQDFLDCKAAIEPQVDHLTVVAHQCDYVTEHRGSLIPYNVWPPNISVAWNLGLRYVAQMAAGRPYDVAVLNDDAIVPANWFTSIIEKMRETGAAAGAATRPDDPRMAGFAFILASEAGLYADEQFEWWYGDDDLARRAEQAGGIVQVAGIQVEHRHPNSTTVGVLADKAAEDRHRYERKWSA